MCGIVGYTGPATSDIFLKQMNSLQYHRGPDDEGYFRCEKNNVHLAMRRLSIIDLENGKQPMQINNGDLVIIFNGEIFNAPSLRVELENEGIIFETKNSDTEVLIRLYAKEGIKMLEKLNGMFAFSIYDKKRNQIYCVRDHFGIKPLYYSVENSRLSFASELKSLSILPWITKAFDYHSIYHFFSFQYVPSPDTIYSKVKKLAPAHYIRWNLKDNSYDVNKYWTPEFNNRKFSNLNEASDYNNDELKKAVSRWTLSDVPIACSLSGGIDSSSISAIVAMQQNKKIKTFTLGFSDSSEIDERDTALKLSEMYQTDHSEIVISPKDLLRDLDKMLVSLGEPYAGGLPSWFVFKEMSKVVKVGMTGTGADELFGNYGKWYPYEKPYYKSKSFLKYLFKNSGSLKELKNNERGCYYHPLYFTDRRKKNKFFSFEFLESIQNSSEKFIEFKFDNNLNVRDAITKLDLNFQLSDEFLYMTDSFSMAHSIEMRTPFLDIELVKSILSIPSKLRTYFNDPKKLLKLSVKEILPEELLQSPKRGFILPMDKWLKNDLREELIRFSETSYLKNQKIFDINLQKNFIKPFLDNRTSNTDQVWTWWLFQRWYQVNESHH
jgi:asparagine synthase (glutamine-hydrolysing)